MDLYPWMPALVDTVLDTTSPAALYAPVPLTDPIRHALWGRLTDAGVKTVALTLRGPGHVADQAFGQVARGFGFPGYFGWNWNAIVDCLRDLEAANGPYCVLVPNPDDTFTPSDRSAWEALLVALLADHPKRSEAGVQLRVVVG